MNASTLRDFFRRGRARWFVVGAVGAALVAVVALWAVLPGMVRSTLESAGAARGLAVETEGLGLSFGGVSISSLKVRSREPGVTAEVRDLRVDVGVMSWLRGSRRITALRASHVDIDVQIPSPGLAALRRSSDGAQDSGGTSETEGGSVELPRVDLGEIDVVVRDADGIFAELEDGALEADGQALTARAKRLLLRGGGDDLSIGEAEWRGEKRGAAYALRGGQVATAVLSRDAKAEGDAGGQRDAAGIGARALAMRAALRGARAHREDSSPASASAGPRILPVQLAEDFLFAVDAFSVETREPGGDRTTVLPAVRLSAARQGSGAIKLTGGGAPAAGGKLSWALVLWPDKLSAEGTISFERLPLSLFAAFLPALPWFEPERSRLSGELSIVPAGAAGSVASAARFSGHVNAENVALSSERIAPVPVAVANFAFRGAGTWDPVARRLAVDEGALTVGRARAELKGTFEWAPDHYLVDAQVDAPPMACGDVVGAIPTALLGDLVGFSWGGSLAGHFGLHVDSRALDATKLDLTVADRCLFTTVPALADLRRFDRPFEHRVTEPDGASFAMETGPGTPNWTPIDYMSPFFVHSVLAHEDAGFFGHRGFAVWAIEGALKRNLAAGRYVQGASTITMQLAKNVFLHREKTLARKVQEVLLTWWLESAMPKRRILELYLNVIEYGPAIYGVRNAAKHYFGREPSDLSLAESAFLATILPNPKAYHQAYDEGLSGKLAARVKQLVAHMAAKGRVDSVAADAAKAELDALAFHRAGAPTPPMHVVKGTASPLPSSAESFEAGKAAAEDAWEADDVGRPD